MNQQALARTHRTESALTEDECCTGQVQRHLGHAYQHKPPVHSQQRHHRCQVMLGRNGVDDAVQAAGGGLGRTSALGSEQD